MFVQKKWIQHFILSLRIDTLNYYLFHFDGDFNNKIDKIM